MNLQTAAQLINADVSAISPALLPARVNGVSIDSRAIRPGEIFFAFAQPDYRNNGFNGDFDDAHQFVVGAIENGALAAVVHRDKIDRADLQSVREKLLPVADGIQALQQFAAGVYRNWNKPVVAVTGSAGKTTAKTLTVAVLEATNQRILTNIKNYNNGIGHPLTVLRLLDEDADLAVLEMGMSTPQREIERLCRITPPDVAIELNVLPVHLEHLGTIENIQAAKRELVENMKPSGTAVLNHDDPRVMQMREQVKGAKVLTFGLENQADVWASEIEAVKFGETKFLLHTPRGTAEVALQLVGRHNVLNALAAAAAGLCFDLTPDAIAARLNQVATPPMRGEVLRFEQFEAINDAYNSNPDALVSMVQTLIENGAHAIRKIVIAGEMLELGAEAAEIHFQTGQKIGASGIDVLWGVRGFGQNLVDGARESGLRETKFFNDSDAAADAIINEVRAGDLILVKGSRGVQTEKIVARLAEKFATG